MAERVLRKGRRPRAKLIRLQVGIGQILYRPDALFAAIRDAVEAFFDLPPPLLLGLVLGGIAENNFFIASRIYGYTWLWHPGVLIIGLIIAGGIAFPYLQKRITRGRTGGEGQPVEEKSVSTRREALPVSTRIGQSLFALFILGIFVYVVYQAKYGFGAFEPRAALFPWVIGVPSLLLAIYVFIKDACRSSREVELEEPALYTEPEVDPSLARQRTIAIAGWTLAFFLAIWILGFVPATAIASFLYLKFGARETWPVTVVLTAVCWLFFFGVFDYALHMPFPKGAFFDWMDFDIGTVRDLFAAAN